MSFLGPEGFRRHLPTAEDFEQVRHRWYRVVVLATLTGVLVGLAVAAFEAVVGRRMLEWTLDLPVGLRFAAPAVGVILAWFALRFVGRGASPATSDAYLDAYHHHDGELPLREVPGKTLGAAATLGLGGAMGFEGPSIYLGAAIGSAIRRRFPRAFDADTGRVLLVAGAAAGVSAIFKAPATGAVFALEVPYREDSAAHAVVPAIVASAASYITYVAFFGLERIFLVRGKPTLEWRDLVGALVIGLLAGFGARGFARLMRASKHAVTLGPAWLRIGATGAGLAAVAAATYYIYDAPLSLGPGYGAIDWTRAASRSLGLLLLLLVVRAVATSLTVAAGGVGGLFIPLFVEGWILGAAVEAVFNTNTILFPVIGAAAFLGAGFRTPIAAVVFVAETTGRPGFIVPALLATAVAQLVMGRQSVTAYQYTRRRDPLELALMRPASDAAVAVPVCAPDESVRDVLARPDLRDAPAVAVVDGETWIGMVDALRAAQVDPASLVGEITRADLVVGTPEWTVGQSRDALDANSIPVVPIVDQGRLVGVVTAASILALVAAPRV